MNELKVTRGAKKTINIAIYDDEVPYVLEDNEKVIFRVVQNSYKEPIIEKEAEATDDEGIYSCELCGEDTQAMGGLYWYDVSIYGDEMVPVIELNPFVVTDSTFRGELV